MQVFTTTGNHEAASSSTYTSNISDPQCIAYNFNKIVGNHMFYYVENGKYTYWDISPGKYTVATAKNKTVKDPSIVLPEGDVYIFLGILGDANNNLFWDDAFQWIYETLEANKNKRCFVFEHVRAERMANYANGSPTDDLYKSYVSGNPGAGYLKALWGDATNADRGGLRAKTFESLMSHYTNCIWFHGHTHATADTPQYDGKDGSDIVLVDSFFGNKYSPYAPQKSANNTRWTWSVHIPSSSEVRSPAGIDKDGSEGIVMDVYKNKVVLKYIRFSESSAKGVSYVNEFYDEEVHELDTTLDDIGKYTPTYADIGEQRVFLIDP